MKRRARRAPGEFVRGDIVVVRPWKFRLQGIRSETERRVGVYMGEQGGVVYSTPGGPVSVYCPVGGWVCTMKARLVRASAAQERSFHAKWDELFEAMRGLGGR